MYTAFSLLEKGVNGSDIGVIGQYHPGDQSTLYTSPWAGGNFSCISPDDYQTLAYDKYTYMNLHKIQRVLGDKCGLDNAPTTEFWDFIPNEAKIKLLETYLKDYRTIPKEQLPMGAKFGVRYTTWNFNCPLFLKNMQLFLEKKGVIFIRKHLKHIQEAFINDYCTVFNCSGLGANNMGGVEDAKVYPVRGKVVVVKAPHIQENRLRWGTDSATYIIQRPHSMGQLVLGGLIQKDNWTGDTFEKESEDILSRVKSLLPKLNETPLEIIRVAAGLRPYREGGARIEKDILPGNRILIHNYGAGGYGYQAGFGMADNATSLYLNLNPKL